MCGQTPRAQIMPRVEGLGDVLLVLTYIPDWECYIGARLQRYKRDSDKGPRCRLTVEEAMKTLTLSFNGPSYAEFKKQIDEESIGCVLGKNWWGYYEPPTNFSRC